MTWNVDVVKAPLGLLSSFHTSAICNEKVYIFGGYKQYPNKAEPRNDVVIFEPASGSIETLQCKEAGPKKSHHKAVTLNDHCICIIGGWNGSKRTTDVWLFDTEKLSWRELNASHGSIPPAGLSSHTCTAIAGNEIIITGREGGVHMQRRFGSVFKLKINQKKNSYEYQELEQHISSRSGHTACLLETMKHEKQLKHKKCISVFGGRDSTYVDLVNIGIEPPGTLLNENFQNAIQKAMDTGKHFAQETRTTPLKNHAAFSGTSLAILQGGELFGRARNSTNGEMFLTDISGSRWWKANLEKIDSNIKESFKRFGHTMAWINGHLYLIGGIKFNGQYAISDIIDINFP